MASCREEFQKQLLQKEVKHDEEVNLLKADMLVAIQVARSGNASPNGGSQPDSQTVANTITRAGMKLSLEVCVCFLCVRRRGGLTVNALATGWSSSALSLFQGHHALSLGKTLHSHSVSLDPGV